MNDISQFNDFTQFPQDRNRRFFAPECVIIFARDPASRQVKTRLMPIFAEPQHAAEFYAAMLADTLRLARIIHARRARYGAATRFLVAATPRAAFADKNGRLSQLWRGAHFAQAAGDLGERMQHALAQGFAAGASRIVLIGSDAPDLPARYIIGALEQLADHDFVLGPCSDGGFYLIGARQLPAPDLWRDVTWSSASTLRQVWANARLLSQKIALLPAWRDVDTPPDLRALITRLQSNAGNAPHSRAWLQSHDLL